MASTSLVTRAQELSKRLQTVLSLLPADDILDLSTKLKPAASFLFEMVVLHQLLVGLRSNGWTLSVIAGTRKHRFARAPALKKHCTYIEIIRGGAKYQVVHGTKVADRFDEPRAPDISLQFGNAPLDPAKEHVIALWDVKLRGLTGKPTSKRISDAEFRSFLSVLNWLGAPRPGSTDGVLDKFPLAFRVRGLITNGLRPSEPDALFLEEGVSVSESFENANTPCHPARETHLSSPGSP